ncbi:hypothetical protein EDD18DRAFT_1156943 [Armillaria luteobubalina]|uniref:Hydrophobin n=1 Tax=Armillaria luteobubalina TaxID=153913 RepID=A0AA39QAR0_9AGAR|nr:hypothetical protein EDD18DRAFT_1156943 [Armillaria luteobubalina]
MLPRSSVLFCVLAAVSTLPAAMSSAIGARDSCSAGSLQCCKYVQTVGCPSNLARIDNDHEELLASAGAGSDSLDFAWNSCCWSYRRRVRLSFDVSIKTDGCFKGVSLAIP